MDFTNSLNHKRCKGCGIDSRGMGEVAVMGRLEELKSRFSEEDLSLQSFNWKTSIKTFSENKKPVRQLKNPSVRVRGSDN